MGKTSYAENSPVHLKVVELPFFHAYEFEIDT